MRNKTISKMLAIALIFLPVVTQGMISCTAARKYGCYGYEDVSDYYLKNRYKPASTITSPYLREYREKLMEDRLKHNRHIFDRN